MSLPEQYHGQHVEYMIWRARENAELQESRQERKRQTCLVSTIGMCLVVRRWLTALYWEKSS